MSGPDRVRAREKYRRLAANYDRRVVFSAPLRRGTVDRLRLSAEETCLEVACGTGINFGLIEKRIGASGQLVGLDISPEMLELALARVAREGWSNVSLVEASVEDAQLPAAPDAVLFSLTHDVLQMPDGLANVFGQSAPGARVAVFGPMLSARTRAVMRPVVRRAVRPFVTTLEGLDRPWRHLEPHVPDLTVEPVLAGAAYIAWGTLG